MSLGDHKPRTHVTNSRPYNSPHILTETQVKQQQLAQFAS